MHDDDEKSQTNMWAGSIDYFIQVELVISHPQAIDSLRETRTYRFAEQETPSTNLYDCTWRNDFIQGAIAEREMLLPISRLAVAFLKGPVSDTAFKIMLKPNLLIMWNPHQENLKDNSEQDSSDDDCDVDICIP